QLCIFSSDPATDARASWKLRVDYAIPSPSFADAGHFVPKDKSVDSDGPLADAGRGTATDAECWLDLGGIAGMFRVSAIPLPTPREDRGPGDEHSVVAILEPLELKVAKNSASQDHPSLFG